MSNVLKWVSFDERMPHKGERVICAKLNEYTNAPWTWSFYIVVYGMYGEWGKYEELTMWASIPAPGIPMNAKHKKALAVYVKEQEYLREKLTLDKRYGK